MHKELPVLDWTVPLWTANSLRSSYSKRRCWRLYRLAIPYYWMMATAQFWIGHWTLSAHLSSTNVSVPRILHAPTHPLTVTLVSWIPMCPNISLDADPSVSWILCTVCPKISLDVDPSVSWIQCSPTYPLMLTKSMSWIQCGIPAYPNISPDADPSVSWSPVCPNTSLDIDLIMSWSPV